MVPFNLPLLSSASVSSGDDDWPMFHHDLQHSGYSTSTAPNTNQTLWSSPSGGIVFSPAIADGKLYLSIWEGALDYVTIGRVYCFDAATGVFIWSYETGGYNMVSSPAVADGKVYACADDSKVYCLNATTGTHIWHYTTSAAVMFSSPTIADGKIYLCTGGGNVYCLNAETGAFIWNYTTGANIWFSSPAVADGKVYVGSEDTKVYCLNAETGAYIWSYSTGGSVHSSPAVVNGKVYVGSEDFKVYCLDAADGTYIWSYTTIGGMGDMGVSFSSPAIVDGKVYIGSMDTNVYCLNATTGALIWSYTIGSYVDSSPAVADGKVYIGSWYGEFCCFGSPCICDFDSLFKYNNVRMIYPSDQAPKPLGCSPASVSDWTASAFISTKLEAFTEGLDTDSAFVNQATGKPMGAAGTGVISFGGPIVNLVVAYAENDATPIGDRAPLEFFANDGTCYFQHQDGTSIPGANLLSSVIDNNADMFIVEVYRDGDGRYMLLCYGFGWKGTYAAGKYFDSEIYPNLATYPYTWTIVKWEDTNGNGFVNTAADGDTYTVIATG
jgi:outer membrane protein assembly factor BamB